jgi:hypothetical protein
MARIMEQAYAGECPDCGWLFSTMGHGLSDIEIDVTNPSIGPFWATNIRFICATDNHKKRRKSPEEYAIYCREAKRWKNEPRLDPNQSSFCFGTDELFSGVLIAKKPEPPEWQTWIKTPSQNLFSPSEQLVLI